MNFMNGTYLYKSLTSLILRKLGKNQVGKLFCSKNFILFNGRIKMFHSWFGFPKNIEFNRKNYKISKNHIWFEMSYQLQSQ